MSPKRESRKVTQPSLSAKRRKMLRERFVTVPFINHLGFELKKLTCGEVRIAMPVSDELRQYQGLAHGGAIAALADTAATFTVLTALPDADDIVTVEFKINFLSAVRSGTVVATAKPVRIGRRICVADVAVSNGRRAVATGLFTMATLPGDHPIAS